MSLRNRITVAYQAFMGQSAPAEDDDFWYNTLNLQGTIPGTTVTPEKSLAVVAVHACVSRISEGVGSLPFNVYRRIPNDRGKETAVDHPLHWIIRYQPNEYQTAMEFWQTALVHCLTAGNAYALVDYSADGRRTVRGLHLIAPNRVQVEWHKETRTKYFRVQVDDGKSPEVLYGDAVLHIPGMGYDGLIGYSPIETMRRAVELSQATEIYQARFFANNAVPNAYISFPVGATLSPAAREELRGWLKKNHGGLANAHNPGVFESGGKIETVPLNHRDMQYLELRKFQLDEISRIYNVPAHKLQNLERMTNNNIEYLGTDWGTGTLRPWCTRIEQRVNSTLLGVKEVNTYFAEFNMDAVLRADSQTRGEFYSKLIASGVMTPNEARSKENLNWLPGGDRLMIQGAMIPLEDAGKQQGAPAAKPAG